MVARHPLRGRGGDDVNDELRERLGYPTARILCLALQPDVYNFPARCVLDRGHDDKSHRDQRYGPVSDMTIWEDPK